VSQFTDRAASTQLALRVTRDELIFLSALISASGIVLLGFYFTGALVFAAGALYFVGACAALFSALLRYGEAPRHVEE
jgi:hypothetical protein